MDTYAELAPKKKAEAVEIYLKEIAKLTAQQMTTFMTTFSIEQSENVDITAFKEC